MNQLFKMAYRDLGRNRRRSFFSALALGIGLALLMLMAGVVEGEMRNAMEASIKLQSGHLQVRTTSYDENKNSLAWEDLIENPGEVASQIAALGPVKAATPRLFASGIVSSGEQSIGVSIIGIDPVSQANDPYREGMISGEFLAEGDREGALIGETLANKLKLGVGDTLTLLANTADGDVDEQEFIIRGIFATDFPTYDASTVFLTLDKAQAITKTENHATVIFVLLNNREQAGQVAAALPTERYKVVTWEEMNELIVQMETFSEAYMVILYLVVIAVTATVIINTLVMAVFERTREIGILSAVGMKSSHIMGMFFIESSLLAVGGIVIGLILGYFVTLYASKVGFYIGDYGITGVLLGERIYAFLTLKDTVTLSIVAFVVTLVGSLYPAILAARMEPVEALHGGK